MPTKKYCSNCQTHTQHQVLPTMYATACTICGSHTSELIRAQAESHAFTAPDGTTATVVSNTPDQVTYYIADGDYQGYYHYDKRTKAKRIEHS